MAGLITAILLPVGAMLAYGTLQTAPGPARWSAVPRDCPELPRAAVAALGVPTVGQVEPSVDRDRNSTCRWESERTAKGHTVRLHIEVRLFRGLLFGTASNTEAARHGEHLRARVRSEGSSSVDPKAEPDLVALSGGHGVLRLIRVVDNAVVNLTLSDIERLGKAGPADAGAVFAAYREPLKQVADAIIASLR